MTKRPKREGEGNTLASAAAFTREMIRVAEVLHRYTGVLEVLDGPEIYVTGISVRTPRHEGDEFFATVRGDAEGEKVVAFHSADSLVALMVGVCSRIENRSLKWRADEFR